MSRSSEVFPYLQDRGRLLEVDGFPVKSISSNVRFPIVWSSVRIQPEGIAMEGDLLLVTARTDGARNQIENPETGNCRENQNKVSCEDIHKLLVNGVNFLH